jgi:hypothetical protein
MPPTGPCGGQGRGGTGGSRRHGLPALYGPPARPAGFSSRQGPSEVSAPAYRPACCRPLPIEIALPQGRLILDGFGRSEPVAIKCSLGLAAWMVIGTREVAALCSKQSAGALAAGSLRADMVKDNIGYRPSGPMPA